jgi:hypothetical protein
MKKLIAVGLILAAGAAFAQQTAKITVPVTDVKQTIETREVIVVKEVAVAAAEPISIMFNWPQTVTDTNGAAKVLRKEIQATAVQRLVDANGQTIGTTRHVLTEAQLRSLAEAAGFRLDDFIAFVAGVTKAVTEAKE